MNSSYLNQLQYACIYIRTSQEIYWQWSIQCSRRTAQVTEGKGRDWENKEPPTVSKISFETI